jgi:dihydropyrimidinase
MDLDLLVKNGRVVFPYGGITRADIGVKGGEVVGMYADASEVKAGNVIDVCGKFILPGMIDSHTHMGLGSSIENEYESESRSAAVGGITTMMSYTNCTNSYGDHFKNEKKAGEERSIVDFALHFSLMNDIHLKEIPRYIEEFGVSSFKFFMNFRGEEGIYFGVEGIDDGYMFDCFSALSHYHGSCAVVHAENIEIVWRLRDRLIAEGRNDLLAWTESRPHFIEVEAIQRALFYGEITNCSVYIAHVTTRDGLHVIRDYKRRKGKVYCETCPHYLMFHAESGLGSLGKVNPPLKDHNDVEALWEGVTDGSIDCVTSDHVARRKEKKIGTIWEAANGFPGLATTLPILLGQGVNKGRFGIERIADMNCSTAKIFNLYPRKGTIEIGSDADFTIVDPDLEKEVNVKDLKSACDYSLFEGLKLKGWPVMTIVRGQVVMNNGQITAEPGYGIYLNRSVPKR